MLRRLVILGGPWQAEYTQMVNLDMEVERRVKRHILLKISQMSRDSGRVVDKDTPESLPGYRMARLSAYILLTARHHQGKICHGNELTLALRMVSVLLSMIASLFSISRKAQTTMATARQRMDIKIEECLGMRRIFRVMIS